MTSRLWFALLLVGCSSDGSSERICAACEPEQIGDTGDLGGSLTACGYYRAPEPVDAARAVELGFDVDALERVIARPLDMPMEWRASTASAGGGPARGYDPATQLSVRVESLRSYRHVRPDPAYCDGTTCRFPGQTVPQATCAHSLETDVRVEVATADGAVRGSLAGKAMQFRAGSEGEGSGLEEAVGLVSASAPLSAVEGTLRLDPKRGAKAYRTALWLNLWCNAEATNGELSPRVFIEETDVSGIDYAPLYGVFPPQPSGAAAVDAGAPR